MRGLRMMLHRSARNGHDRLLDAAHDHRSTTSTPGPPDPLAELLRAAAAPPRERELAGEEAAVAAFRAARRPATVTPAPARRHRRTAVTLAWAAGLAATATAGAALAAGGLHRPGPSVPEPVVTSTAVPAPGAGEGAPTGEPSPVPTGGPAATTPATPASASRTPPASPTPTPDSTLGAGPGNSDNTSDRPGLCRAYLAKSERQRERALGTPAFRELVVAAGGAEHVEAYCRDLLADADPEPTG